MDYLYPSRDKFQKKISLFFQEIDLFLVPWERYTMVRPITHNNKDAFCFKGVFFGY